jgi:hypothetical protein
MATRGRGTVRRWSSKQRGLSNGVGQRHASGMGYCVVNIGGGWWGLCGDLGGSVPRSGKQRVANFGSE